MKHHLPHGGAGQRARAGGDNARMLLLTSIVDSSGEAIVSTTLDGIVTSWNPAAEAIYGYEADEIIGKRFSLLGYEDRPDELVKILTKIRNGQRVEHYEAVRVRKDGQAISVSLTVSPVHDADGAVIGASSIAHDITERKHADAQALVAPEYARNLIEASLDPLVTINPEGKITDVNEATIKVTGAPREKLVGTDFSDYFTEPERAREGYQQVFAKGSVTDYPLTIRHRDGRQTDVLYNASVYKDARGDVLGVFAAARDLTGSALAERKFQTLIESAPDAMVLASMDGSILLINNQAERLFGYQRDEVLGKAVEMLIPTRFRSAHPGHRSKFFHEPRLRPMGESLDLWGLRKDGSEFQIEISLTPIESPQGLTVSATIRDVTIQKAALQYARSLIEASLDPLVTISPEGKITDVNEAAIMVTGTPRESLVGTDFSDYFTQPERAREGYRQVFAKGFITDYPLTIRHRDGRLTDVLYNASVYKDARGNVLGVFAGARDVMESKSVIREFTETKNLLDNILQSSTKYSIIGKDLDHRILTWNEGARRNYGYSAEEVLGKNAQILNIPEDVKSGRVEALLKTAYDDGLAEGEFIRVRKDGDRFAANVVVTRRNDASGNAIGYLLMSNDISDKKQAEEQARANAQYVRSLIEASLDPLVTINAEGKITDVNEATATVTGASREELIGADFSDYFTEPERAREGYQQVFAKGSITDYPLTIRHKNHKLTEVLYNGSVYKDPRGDVLGVFATARDVTAQKKAEAEIVGQLSRELERRAELERFQRLTVGRELKMIELKKEIEELKMRAIQIGME